MKEDLLLIAAALIVLFFVFQLLKGFLLARRPWKKSKPRTNPELEALLQKADTPAASRHVLRDIDSRAARKDASARASYYSMAGEIALHRLKRPNVAIRYYYRALRNNPGCESAFDSLSEILIAQKRFRRFKRTCWYLLSRMDDEDTGSAIWQKCWSGLATVYASSPTTTDRADAIRKMLSGMGTDVAEDELAKDLDAMDDDDIDEIDTSDRCSCDDIPKIGP